MWFWIPNLPLHTLLYIYLLFHFLHLLLGTGGVNWFMDIDLLLVTGGWFLGSKLMETVYESPTKSPFLLLLVALLFVVPLFARPADFAKTSTMDLPRHSSSSPSSSSSYFSSSSTDQQYKMAAHEVPSGPNPESNK